jgi:hypothetical protein
MLIEELRASQSTISNQQSAIPSISPPAVRIDDDKPA